MRYVLLIAVLALAPVAVRGQAPAYQRTRGGAGDWQTRGSQAQHWRGASGGYGGFYNPYFAAPPIVAGSYYERPYPYHFDYFRDRWAVQQPAGLMEPQLVAPDCPCADPAPVEVVQ
jgi:hypothetical protein